MVMDIYPRGHFHRPRRRGIVLDSPGFPRHCEVFVGRREYVTDYYASNRCMVDGSYLRNIRDPKTSAGPATQRWRRGLQAEIYLASFVRQEDVDRQ